MRVTFSKLESGRWEAVACDESPPVLLKDVGEDQDWPPIYMSPQRFIAHGATPWEASAALFAGHEEWHPSMRAGWPTVGDCEIDWASLPWTEKRIAYGIVMGVLELFGATPSSQKAIRDAMAARDAEELGLPADASAEDVAMFMLAAATRSLRAAVDDHADGPALRALHWLGRLGAGFRAERRLLTVALDHGLSGRKRGRRDARRVVRALEARYAQRYPDVPMFLLKAHRP